MSLFASIVLAGRIEQAQCRQLTDSIAAIEQDRPEVRPWSQPLGGGVASFSEPGSPLNKVIGLGFSGPVDPAELDAIEAKFAERGVGVQIELASLAGPAVGAMLTRRGYVLVGFEDVLGRSISIDAVERPIEDIEIRRGDASDFDAWLDTLVTGFGTPDTKGVASHEQLARDTLERVMGDQGRAVGFERYVALRDGVIAGGAGLHISEGVATMCGAATLPTHRRHGVQKALLNARLSAAVEVGCDLAVVTALPGSQSSRNIQRRGFSLLYTRAILARDVEAS